MSVARVGNEDLEEEESETRREREREMAKVSKERRSTSCGRRGGRWDVTSPENDNIFNDRKERLSGCRVFLNCVRDFLFRKYYLVRSNIRTVFTNSVKRDKYVTFNSKPTP